jgi:hypothetical protein
MANVISACIWPKLRTANTFENFLIAPRKAVTPLPFTPFEVKSGPHLARSKIVSTEDPPRQLHRDFLRIFPQPCSPNELGPFPAEPIAADS